MRTGLIPAHAGKTIARLSSGLCARAHPRSRGENLHGAIPLSAVEGSSPLTRGKLVPRHPGREHNGLIPAHAGKTGAHGGPSNRTGAHPRSRGENPEYTSVLSRIGGSSPLTRGKLPDRGSGRKAGRLIPAHAGKTSKSAASGSAPQAHPRSRGENSTPTTAEA